MACIEQIDALISFMESHKELALGRCSRSKEGRSLTKRLWAECAEILNNISLDCQVRSPERWRIFYNEYKSKLLRKIKKQKAELQATGGGPAANITLTPLQERLYNIVGGDVGEPLEGDRHNSLFSLEDNADVGVHEIPISVYNTPAQAVSFEVTQDVNNVSAPLEPVISIVDSVKSTEQASHVEIIGTVEPTPRPYRGSTHRRCRSLEGSPHRSVHEPTSHLEEAQRRLAEIEDQRTTAITAALDRMGTAIGEAQCRLAEMEDQRTTAITAALDRMGRAIGQPLDRLATVLNQLLLHLINSSDSPPLRKRARIIIPSESDSD